jgi:uncharacterized Zn finger protein
MSYWRSFGPYVTVAEKRAKAEKKMKALRKKNPNIQPVVIEGRALARTWWGKSWNSNLECYADYSNRIERGRSYVRNCAVLDLQIKPGLVESLVQGTDSNPYEIRIEIKTLKKKTWGNIKKACQGEFDSLQELMNGKFPESLSNIFTDTKSGLFPAPKEISFDCSCPDWADMCKHVAATLYGIGARLDSEPELFFTLRGVEVKALVSGAVKDKTSEMLKKARKKSPKVMADSDLSEIFGIDLDIKETPAPKKARLKSKVKARSKVKPVIKPATKKAKPSVTKAKKGKPKKKAATTAGKKVVRKKKGDA